MSAQRAKIYVRLFAALSLSVLANIILFQPRLPQRGPFGGAESSASGGEAKAMRLAAVPASPARPRSPEQTAESIRAVQRELKELGHYPGQIDGRSSPLTHAAVLAYEQQHGIALTGEPTDALLKGLILGPTANPPATTGGPGLMPGSAAERLVQDVRGILSSLGYNAGRQDGRLSPELIRAIRAYEADNGLQPPTGRITATLLLHLQRKQAAFRAR